VDAHLLGDLRAAPAAHRHRAELEEVALAAHDGLGDVEDGREALLDVCAKVPARIVQVTGHFGVA